MVVSCAHHDVRDILKHAELMWIMECVGVGLYVWGWL